MKELCASLANPSPSFLPGGVLNSINSWDLWSIGPIVDASNLCKSRMWGVPLELSQHCGNAAIWGKGNLRMVGAFGGVIKASKSVGVL